MIFPAMDSGPDDSNPSLAAHAISHEPSNARMAGTPLDDLPTCIAAWNLAFGRSENPNGRYSRLELMNMSTHAAVCNEPHLARMLSRHVQHAKEVI